MPRSRAMASVVDEPCEEEKKRHVEGVAVYGVEVKDEGLSREEMLDMEHDSEFLNPSSDMRFVLVVSCQQFPAA